MRKNGPKQIREEENYKSFSLPPPQKLVNFDAFSVARPREAILLGASLLKKKREGEVFFHLRGDTQNLVDAFKAWEF